MNYPRRLKVLGHTRFHFGSDDFSHILYCDNCFYSSDFILRSGKKCLRKMKAKRG